jgi:hypothetical protein
MQATRPRAIFLGSDDCNAIAGLGRAMRDLITRRCTAPTPAGIAFEISDLLLIRCWAALHDLDALICRDHGAEDEEHEEVVEFRTAARSCCQFILWRNAKAVFLQPIMDRKTKHLSVAAALESLLLKLCRPSSEVSRRPSPLPAGSFPDVT